MTGPRTIGFALMLLAIAADGTGAKERPALDAAAPAAGAQRVPFAPRPEDMAKIRPGSRVQVDETVGLPTFLWAAAPGGEASALAALSPEKAARRHLAAYASLYHLASDEIASAVLEGVHDTGFGVVVASFRREIGGVPVFRDAIRVAMDRSHRLVALSGFLAGRAHVKNDAVAAAFVLDGRGAIAAAFRDYAEVPLDVDDLESRGEPEGGFVWFERKPQAASLGGGFELRPSRARRIHFRAADRIEPAFHVEIEVASVSGVDSDLFAYVVSAADGRILLRHDLTVADAYTYRVWADTGGLNLPFDGPQGTAPTPHPTGNPDGFQGAFVLPNLVTLQNGPISTNDPWLPTGAGVTTGNNADAYADLASPDGFSSGDIRPTTTGGNSFNRIYDTSQSPAVGITQRMAAVTQLFYDVNFLHDWFYDVGFDEASGNAQASNYGRGGIENDSMRAEAQDYGGRNNANMSTPADGGRPRMQMYVFDANPGRTVNVNAPASIAGAYASGIAVFGPQTFNVTAGVVLVNDGSGTATDACESPFVNAAAISGNIAFLDRGSCNFTVKVKNAQLNGAVGVLVANNAAGGIQSMSGTDATITVPSLFISQADGNTLRGEIGAGESATLTRQAAPDRDGDLDNQIVAHEWGHYISNRLIGNGVGLTNNQGGSMGEGWGDFHALLMSVRPEDAAAPANADFGGVYGLAGYVLGGGANGPLLNDSYYFGIRRVPYSTDFTKNPLTFRHIENGVPLPNTAPIAFGASGSNNAEVHNSGEVWATMLWECYASLLRDTGRLTFDQARDRMRAYLVAAYKLTPASPTFLEARDALLAAAHAGDPADYVLFWQAFARRGAGISAVAPDRYAPGHPGVVESYVSGNALEIVGVALDDGLAWCDGDGYLDSGETGRLTVTVRNVGTGSLAATTVSAASISPGVSFPQGSVIALPPSQPTEEVSASLPVTLSGATAVAALDFEVSVDDPALALAGPVAAAAFRGHVDAVPGQSAADDFESENTLWTIAGNPGLSPLAPWRRVAVTGRDHRWHGPDDITTADQYLVSPPLDVAPAAPFSFSFVHRHSFESSGGTFFDGGVVELTTTGGASWIDVGGAASPGYNGTLVSSSNPLAGRAAYCGVSGSYPAPATVTIDLGGAYAGQTVQVRFRTGSDPAVPAPGWELDEIAFDGITNLPFDALVDDRAICIDSDVDGTVDLADCSPFDATTWAAPGEAPGLLVEGPAVSSLTWGAPSSPGSAATTYDLLRSTTPESFVAADCLESGIASLAASDSETPVSGGFYYLVRSRNACGGNLGKRSDGTPRVGVDCP